MKLQDQLAEAILEALKEEGLTQAEFARTLGVTTKHINHLVQGKSGALGLFDYAAFTLNREWVVELRYRSES